MADRIIHKQKIIVQFRRYALLQAIGNAAGLKGGTNVGKDNLNTTSTRREQVTSEAAAD